MESVSPSSQTAQTPYFFSKPTNSQTSLFDLHVVLAKRPDAGGTAGKKLQLLANVYRLRFKKSAEAGISHYDVTIKFVPGEREPGAPKAKGGDSAINRETSIAVWDKLVTSDPDGLGKSLLHACFDCKKNAFTLGRLNIPGNAKIFRVVLDPEAESRPGREFDVKLQLAQEIDLSILETFTSLRKASNLDDQAATAIMALDVLLRHSSFRKPGVVIGGQGRKFLDVKQATLLGEGAHVLGGLFQYALFALTLFVDRSLTPLSRCLAVNRSVRPTMSGVTVNLDTAFSPYLVSGNLLHVCRAILGHDQGGAGGGGGRGGRGGARGGRGKSKKYSDRDSESID